MADQSITALDLAVAVILGFSALLAFSRGATREALALASWIGAGVVAFYSFEKIRPIIKEPVGNDLATDAITAVLVFLVPLIIFRIISGVISGAVAGGAVGLFDKLIGLAFGIARGALIVAAAYLVGSSIIPREQQPEWVTKALSFPYVERTSIWLAEFLPEDLKKRFDSTAEDAARKAEELRRKASESAEKTAGEEIQDAIGDLIRRQP